MVRRTEHAVYDLKYHLVWVPRYRKSLLVGAIEKRLREVFGEIALHHGLEIVELELMPDHVHLFVGAPPKWAPGKIVGLFKAVSAEVLFREFPELRSKLWGGHLWGAGYYAGSVGDKVTTEIIKRYIRHQRQLTIKW